MKKTREEENAAFAAFDPTLRVICMAGISAITMYEWNILGGILVFLSLVLIISLFREEA